MTRTKRWLAALLTLAMLCVALPAPALAAEAEPDTAYAETESPAPAEEEGTLLSAGEGEPGVQLDTPQLKKAVSVNGGVTLTWGKVKGAKTYRVLRKTSSGKWKKREDMTAVRFTDKSVESGTAYTYTVRCLSEDGASFASGCDETGLTVTYLAAPALSQVKNVRGGVSLTWGKVKGAKAYRVLRKTSSGSWKTLGETASPRLTDKTVKSGKPYAYTVRALTEEGTACGYDETGKSITYLAAPVLRKLKTVSKGVQVTWDKVPGAVRYRIFRKTGGSRWKKVADTKKTSYTDKTADRCIAYTYTVRCVTGNGKKAASGYNTRGKTITSPSRYDVSKLKAAKKNKQIIVVSVDGSRRRLIMYQKAKDGSWKTLLSTGANIGVNGLGKKKEGDHKTPVGNYTFTRALGIKSNPGTRLSYTKVNSSHYWVDDSGSSRYNRLVSTRTYTAFSHGEHIIDYKGVYNYILAISYNKKCTPHKGSAIFLHCWRKKGSPTLGCVAVPESAMKKIMRKVRPGCRIIIDRAKNIKKY